VEADDAQPALAAAVDVRRIGKAAARRAMVLDDDVAVRVAVVVDVQRPAVAERDVELSHSSGRSGVPGRPFGKSSASRRATGSGTSAETSPPKAAISFTPLEETKLTCGRAITSTWPFVTGSYDPGAIAVINFPLRRRTCRRLRSWAAPSSLRRWEPRRA